MKFINNCLIFNKDEYAIPVDAMVSMEMDLMKSLSNATVMAEAAANPKQMERCRRSCARFKELDAILSQIRDANAWPKKTVFSCPFKKEFSDFIASQSEDELINFFMRAALTHLKKQETKVPDEQDNP